MKRQVKPWEKNLLMGRYYSSSFWISSSYDMLQLHQKQAAARMSAAAPPNIVRVPARIIYTLLCDCYENCHNETSKKLLFTDTYLKNKIKKGAFLSQNMESPIYTSWQQEAFPYDKNENKSGK